jgi:peptidoglycan-N-acetylglucosamine deacetylase
MMMVFEDPTRRRWRRAVVTAGVAGALLCVMLVFAGASFAIVPPLPPISEHLPVRIPGLVASRVVPIEAAELGGASDGRSASAASGRRILPAFAGSVSLGVTDPFIATAFVTQEDPRSVIDLKAHVADLDVVFPDWFRFDTPDGGMVTTVGPTVLEILQASQVAVMPRISNLDADGDWRPEVFRALAANDEAHWELIVQLLDGVKQTRSQGVNVDIEGLVREDANLYVEWLSDLTARFHAEGLCVTVDLPVSGEGYDYEAIGKLVDAVVVMAYDEHHPGGEPGPIASRDWFDAGIDELTHRVPPDKLVVSLGGYGYDWRVGTTDPARALSFAEAMNLAREFGAWVETDAEDLNSTFAYTDYDGVQHRVWFLDAVSVWNQMTMLREWGCRGVSLWRLGFEEPTLWQFFPGDAPFDPEALTTVEGWQAVLLAGDGQLLRVTGLPSDGTREISLDRGIIDYAAYRVLPHYFVVEKYGPQAGNQIALTFDDGPDRTWTPRLLDVLRRHGVPATFFVLGDQAGQMPDLVRREVAEGHMLGNHTFGHPNLIDASIPQIRLELNSTQRVIEASAGRQTVLFRAPYDVDTTPTLPDELRPLRAVTQLGYIVVGSDLDSLDYTRPGTAAIVDRVLRGVTDTGSHVVLMHDGGGDRSQTVAAVDRLIPLLKTQGYTFVTPDTLLGVSRSTVMPTVPTSEAPFALGETLLARLRHWAWLGVAVLFVVATAISTTRLLLLLLVILRTRTMVRGSDPASTPPVAVLIPAYNEGRVIQSTLRAILRSEYPRFRVLVIDDGSTDDTAARVGEIAAVDPRVEVISTPNGGKHSALNLGFRLAREEVIVTVDADTVLLPETIGHLVAPFADAGVDAVCGNVHVGNVGNLLTASQDAEYVTSQSFDRRAFDSLNAVPVVPGATGAWRRRTVLEVGGYSGQTLTEDADLTVTVLAHSGRVVFSPWARSVTEVPSTARALFRQRFRWTFGALQTVWKHRRSLGRGRVGLITLPHIMVFQLVFPLVSPVGDLAAVACLVHGDYRTLALAYLLFTTLDLIASAAAFWLDRHSWRTIWVVLIQRFYYRQFMYVVTFRAVLEAIRGRRHGWNKLDRQATVTTVPGTPVAGTAVPSAS